MSIYFKQILLFLFFIYFSFSLFAGNPYVFLRNNIGDNLILSYEVFEELDPEINEINLMYEEGTAEYTYYQYLTQHIGIGEGILDINSYLHFESALDAFQNQPIQIQQTSFFLVNMFQRIVSFFRVQNQLTIKLIQSFPVEVLGNIVSFLYNPEIERQHHNLLHFQLTCSSFRNTIEYSNRCFLDSSLNQRNNIILSRLLYKYLFPTRFLIQNLFKKYIKYNSLMVNDKKYNLISNLLPFGNIYYKETEKSIIDNRFYLKSGVHFSQDTILFCEENSFHSISIHFQFLDENNKLPNFVVEPPNSEKFYWEDNCPRQFLVTATKIKDDCFIGYIARMPYSLNTMFGIHWIPYTQPKEELKLSECIISSADTKLLIPIIVDKSNQFEHTYLFILKSSDNPDIPQFPEHLRFIKANNWNNFFVKLQKNIHTLVNIWQRRFEN